MRSAPRPYRDLFDTARRGNQRAVLVSGQATLDALAVDPVGVEWVPAALVLIGNAFAAHEQYREACAYLARGLDTCAGTRGGRDLGSRLDVSALTLATLLCRQGRFGEAVPRLRDLAEPDRRIDIRLGAVRGQLGVAVLFGDIATAHQLVNTATDVARRAKGRQVAALVNGDRVLTLVADGRLTEATALADKVMPLLATPGTNPHQRQANAQAVTVASELARVLAPTGDELAARRWLHVAASAAASGGRWEATQVALARCIVAREVGDPVLADQAGHEAATLCLDLNATPLAARTHLELARLAERQGHLASARALYRRALDQLTPMGMRRELAAAEDGLRRLDECGPTAGQS